jgi:hypothetical protein
MAKQNKTPMPYSAVLGTGIPNQVAGGGTPVTRSAPKGSDNRKPSAKTAPTNRTPTGRSVAGNW